MQYQKPHMFMFFSTLIFSTMMALSASNPIFMWISLELNMMSFIPIMTTTKMNKETEASIKYFLAQASGSGLFLLSSSSIYSMNQTWSQLTFQFIFTSSMAIKLGAAPLHFWFPQVMSNISWMSCFILSTWQKIIPMSMLLSMSSSNLKMTMFLAMTSAFMGAILGLKQTHLPTLMAYSSIAHLGWMLSILNLNPPSMILYFLIYSLSTGISMLIMNSMKIYSFNQILSPTSNLSKMKMIMSFSLLSLGGLPPTLGFLPKLITINMLISSMNPLFSAILLLSSILTLSYYINLTLSMLILSISESPNYLLLKSSQSLLFFIIPTSIMSTSMIPALM